MVLTSYLKHIARVFLGRQQVSLSHLWVFESLKSQLWKDIHRLALFKPTVWLESLVPFYNSATYVMQASCDC